ncbi:MAG: aminoglycoside phosphotransferase family protein [Puniceicoccales bacterium]|jgi:serine/threonine protein kinase|nr:aminoglycoside phosphotransferase family protein [Puniceicoccales bacterium]
MPSNLHAVAANFNIHGDYFSAEPHGAGHINDTYAVTFNQSGRPVRYIFQRVNRHVFKNTSALMRNISRVCRHMRARLIEDGLPDASRRALTIVPTTSGADWFVDDTQNYWRCFLFVEGARAHEIIESPSQAFQVAATFGNFTKLLEDIPSGRLEEVIPDFHNTRKRFENFQKSLAADIHNRAKDAKAEIDFLHAHENDCSVVVDAIARGEIPERVTHNDTKLNNILIDDTTKQGLCVIDLDTSMPGSALYDFGDMVRTATSPTLEDEVNLSLVVARPEYFNALATGFLSSLGTTLNKTEKELLPFSGKLITLEVGMRFLTDYLDGDVYFKTSRTRHNLDRCRNQFALVASIEKQFDAMNSFVATL